MLHQLARNLPLSRILGATILGTIALASLSLGDPATARHDPLQGKQSNDKLPAVRDTVAQSSLRFEPNAGQADPAVDYVARGGGYTMLLTANQATMVLAPSKAASSVVRMQLLGGAKSHSVTAADLLPSVSHYYIGNDSRKWRPNVPNYAKVKYAQVYPGIDLLYYGNQSQLEYDFVVQPGADPNAIRLAYSGPDQMSIDSRGDLILTVDGRELRQRKPLIYQEIGGRHVEVAGGYRITGSEVQFALAQYDHGRKLVIDPTIAYSRYLGGSSYDGGTKIATAGNGNVYVTGQSGSASFPIVNAAQPALGGVYDAFITALDSTGAILYSTFLGGNDGDNGLGIAVDGAGEVYVVGSTSSTNFPGLNAIQPTFGGVQDGFVAKLGASGTLVFSTYLGGSNNDLALAVALDAGGSPYVTGLTASPNFPTLNPLQATLGGAEDVFITKLTTAGALVYSTYFGGTSNDEGWSIAVDTTGAAYITGNTAGTIPVLNAFQPSIAGPVNAFVAKLNAAGALSYSTYLGGSGSAQARGIAVDSAGAAYIAGYVSGAGFPTLNTAAPSTNGSSVDGFMTKLSPAGSLVYSTYFGGASSDIVGGLAIDSTGAAYVAGSTLSSDFPTLNASQVTYGGSGDGFVTKFSPSGVISYSTFLGGAASDSAVGIATDNTGAVFVTGATSGTFPVSPAYQSTFGGGGDGFVVKISPGGAISTARITAISPSSATPGSPMFTLTITGTGFQAGAVVSWNGTTLAATVTATSISATVPASLVASAGTASITVTNPGETESNAAVFTISSGGSGNTLALDQHSLIFGVEGSMTSPLQTILVNTQTGVTWTATSNRSNIVVTGGSGAGLGSFTVRATAGPGGTITVTANGVGTAQTVAVTVNTVTAGNIQGSFDTPVDNTSVHGSIALTGWTVGNLGVTKVDLWREPVSTDPPNAIYVNGLVFLGDAVFIPGARPDIANHPVYGLYPQAYDAGWGAQVLTNGLPNSDGTAGKGNGVYKFHAISHQMILNAQGSPIEQLRDLGTKTVTAVNRTSLLPFGTIDTPSQGGTASGADFVNFGWVLTPQPAMIPIDGSTLTVYIDGMLKGNVTYNQFRSDIASGFPGYANSNGAVGYFRIDTTQMTNGIHNIGWTAVDNMGNIDGIGSRAFFVANNQSNGNSIPAAPFAVHTASRHGQLLFRTGFNPKAKLRPVPADHAITMQQLARIEIHLPEGTTASETLPVGSQLVDGIFYWQLDAAFLGSFHLSFDLPDGRKLPLSIKVQPLELE